MFCPQCGHKNEDNAHRCVQCNSIIQQIPQPPPLVQPSKFPYWIFLLIIPIMFVFIGIIAAIAIPSLLRSRMSANEACAIGSLKTLAAAQTDYNFNSVPHTYTRELACLASGKGAGEIAFIDPALGSGLKCGYRVAMDAGSSELNVSLWEWSATAWPIVYGSTGVRSFYINETGIIRGADINGNPGTEDLPAID